MSGWGHLVIVAPWTVAQWAALGRETHRGEL
jgi:hypothetical protein